MSTQTVTPRERIERIKIMKNFYLEAYRSGYFPNGVVRFDRLTSVFRDGEKSFGYQSVRIKNPEELAKVKPVLDYLAGKLTWQDLPPLLQSLEQKLQKEGIIDPEILRIVQQYPNAAVSLLKAFDKVYSEDVEIDDLPIINDFMNTAFKSLLTKQEVLIKLQLKLVNRLNEEKTTRGITQLLKLLEDYELPQLTSVANIVTDRLRKLQVFEAQIQNEKAYEIKGPNSIHNQLLNALWILNDSYWTLHSNEPLINFLNKEYAVSKDDENIRPDFICANDKNDLIIIELKRPRNMIELKDINQLQNYLVAVDDYQNFDSKKGYIIGKGISPRTQKIVEFQKNIEFKSYVQLVDDCRRRYQEYLDAFETPKS